MLLRVVSFPSLCCLRSCERLTGVIVLLFCFVRATERPHQNSHQPGAYILNFLATSGVRDQSWLLFVQPRRHYRPSNLDFFFEFSCSLFNLPSLTAFGSCFPCCLGIIFFPSTFSVSICITLESCICQTKWNIISCVYLFSFLGLCIVFYSIIHNGFDNIHTYLSHFSVFCQVSVNDLSSFKSF